MASVWIEKRRVSDGSIRFRVRYRLGGSESIPSTRARSRRNETRSAAAHG